MAVLNADTTDLIATRKRRSLERQSDALTSIMGYEKFRKLAIHIHLNILAFGHFQLVRPFALMIP